MGMTKRWSEQWEKQGLTNKRKSPKLKDDRSYELSRLKGWEGTWCSQVEEWCYCPQIDNKLRNRGSFTGRLPNCNDGNIIKALKAQLKGAAQWHKLKGAAKSAAQKRSSKAQPRGQLKGAAQRRSSRAQPKAQHKGAAQRRSQRRNSKAQPKSAA